MFAAMRGEPHGGRESERSCLGLAVVTVSIRNVLLFGPWATAVMQL